MSQNQLKDLSRLCVHTISTKPWCIEEYKGNYGLA